MNGPDQSPTLSQRMPRVVHLGNLASLVVEEKFEGVDHLEVGRRCDVVVTFQLRQESVGQLQRRRVELLAHLYTAATNVVLHLDVSEEPRRNRLLSTCSSLSSLTFKHVHVRSCTVTHVHVVIEHVDLYGGTHTLSSYVCLRVV